MRHDEIEWEVKMVEAATGGLTAGQVGLLVVPAPAAPDARPWDAKCECVHRISQHAPSGGRCLEEGCACPLWRGANGVLAIDTFEVPDVSKWATTEPVRKRTASALAARATHAGVPTDPRVLPFVLRDDVEQTHAVRLVHEIVSAFEKDALDNGIPLALLVIFSADAGRGKSIGICHAAVRSFLSFVYTCAVDLDQVAPWSPEWLRLVGADILVIDDVEQALGNARIMEKLKVLGRQRYRRGSLTVPVGNLLMAQTDADAGGFLDRAMSSRLFEQQEKYKRPWFERIKGPSFRHA